VWWRRGRVELPVQKKVARISTSLVNSSYLVQPSSADRIRLDQPIFLANPYRHQDWSTSTLRHPIPTHRGEVRLDVQPLIRLQLVLLRWQLFFCHLFFEVSGTSACNSVGPPLSKPRAPRMLTPPSLSPPSKLKRPVYFSCCIPPGNSLTFVVGPLSFGHPQLYLSYSMCNVQLKWH
jgi:hypothetical protein